MQQELEGTHSGATFLGKYRIDAILGRGGMGEVYRAENLLIGRVVAIKVLLPEFSRNNEVVQRFLREARAANLVRHPNVVDVQDIDEDPKSGPFLVQELLEGEDLGAYLQRVGRLSLDEIRTVFDPILDAMAFAHARGVVHRDLKPENVFLARYHGHTIPKLLDFGISKIAPLPGEKKLTMTQNLLGSPAYMAPEQVAGAAVDARTDVWALGVMLYEAMSGAFPFDAPTASAMLVSIATTDPIPLSTVAPSTPPSLVEVIHHCLRRDAAFRYANADELRAALRAALELPTPDACDSETGAIAPAAVAPALPAFPSLLPKAPHRKPSKDAERPPGQHPTAAGAASSVADRDMPELGQSFDALPPDHALAQGLSSPARRARSRDAMGTLSGGSLFDSGPAAPIELDLPAAHNALRRGANKVGVPLERAPRAPAIARARPSASLVRALWLALAATLVLVPAAIVLAHLPGRHLSTLLHDGTALSGRSGYTSMAAALGVVFAGFLSVLNARHPPRSLGLLLCGAALLGWGLVIGTRAFGLAPTLGKEAVGTMATATPWCLVLALVGGALFLYAKAWALAIHVSLAARARVIGLVVVASLTGALAYTLAWEATRGSSVSASPSTRAGMLRTAALGGTGGGTAVVRGPAAGRPAHGGVVSNDPCLMISEVCRRAGNR